MPRSPRHAAVLLVVLLAAGAAAAPAAASAKRLVEAADAPPTTPVGETAPGAETTAPQTPAPTSEPVAQQGGGRCALSLQPASPSPVPAGEPVALTGRLSCPESAEGEDRQVTILQRERGVPLHEAETVTTGSEGSFALDPVVDGNATFLARSAGARPAHVRLDATASVTLAGPAGAGAALLTRGNARRTGGINRFAFTGAVAPATAGARVVLQRRWSPGEPWRTVQYARTDDEGRFSFARAFRRSGELSLRAVVHPGRLASYSPVLTYLVAQAQNPALTIAAAENPLPAGSSTTISGVLAAGAGQPVVLLARSTGARFAPVASAATGQGGAYSFTVTPSTGTSYRVRSGRSSSTALFLGVMPVLTLTTPPSSARLGGPLSFEGTLAGAPAGTPVRLERELPGGRFSALASTTVGPAGAFVFSLEFLLAGNETLQVASQPTGGMLGAVSDPFTLTVSPGEAGP